MADEQDLAVLTVGSVATYIQPFDGLTEKCY